MYGLPFFMMFITKIWSLYTMDEKEYCFKSYKKATIQKNIEKYGNSDNAIFEMDALVASLKIENDTLRGMIDWDEEE